MGDSAMKSMMRAAGAGMSLALPHLFVGSFIDAIDDKQLERCQVKHMLSILSEDMLQQGSCERRLDDVCSQLAIGRMVLHLADRSDCDMIPLIDKANDFIHAARSKGECVLVHCFMGCSRSVAFTVAYMMSCCDCDYWQCIDAVTAVRRGADPNFGFRMQLRRFEHSLLVAERERLHRAVPAAQQMRQSDRDTIVERLCITGTATDRHATKPEDRLTSS